MRAFYPLLPLRIALLALVSLGLSLAILPALSAGAPTARATCLHIETLTAFAPRGEIYVTVRPSCTEEDFEKGAPVVAYLEVLVSDLPPVSQDVVVYPDHPRAAETIVFQDLAFAAGDPILVRLIRFGEILSLRSIKAP